MGTSLKTLTRRLATPAIVLVALLLAAAAAHAVAGAAFTSVNDSADGPGHCQNGSPQVNCNLYAGKNYVWIDGGPDANRLAPDGQYFFAVLIPGSQPNPNDRTPAVPSDANLSDEYDSYRNRTFQVTAGEISNYAGTHDYDVDETDNNEHKIRLLPYSNTTNPGGVYILAVCYLGNGSLADSSDDHYPVDPRDCKYDAFKVPGPDITPPGCPPPTIGKNTDGQDTATQLFSDPGGIERIDVLNIVNATYTMKDFFQGSAGTITLTATKIDQRVRARVEILVTDVAGNTIRCDPVVATVRVARHGPLAASGLSRRQTFRSLTRNERRLTIRNGRPGLTRIVARVNGKRFVVDGLRPGVRRRISIRSALRRHDNQVTLRGHGLPGAQAQVAFSG
jgi:hypothetical protein